MSHALPPDLDAWIGKERVQEDLLTTAPALALAATLDRSDHALHEGAALPHAWHWIYFQSAAARSDLGPDGHGKLGAFLPALPHPRRMWAGGTLNFSGRLRLGERATRRSTVESITPKEGRSGPLIFVTVRHRISNATGVVVDEEQDLVYRPASPDAAPAGARAGAGAGGAGAGAGGAGEGDGADERRGRAPAGEPVSERGGAPASMSRRPGPAQQPIWQESFVADEVTLFRFSALTFNGHRIHYDRPYATDVEGYLGLVVHGPLLALLLLEAGVRRLRGGDPSGDVRSFRYRALRPAYCNEPLRLEGLGAEGALRAVHAERGVLMEAELLSAP